MSERTEERLRQLVEAGAEIHPQRIFEAYVTQLQTDVATVDEVLIVKLRYFSEDALKVAERIEHNPSLALDLVHSLSSVMQQLDSQAGASEKGHEAVSLAERFALVFPETVTISDMASDLAPERKEDDGDN